MKHCNTVLGQLLTFLPKTKFEQNLGQHGKPHGNKKIGAWEQLVLLLSVQASGIDSLRQIQEIWASQSNKWYHLGLQSASRSTLADANKRTNPVIFEQLFYDVLDLYRPYLPHRKFSFDEPLFLLDGSLVTLLYRLFDWAKYRTTKGAIRLHTVYDANKQIPHWVNITNGKTPHEIAVARAHWKSWDMSKGSILCFDRGLYDYHWWYELEQSNIYWITKSKSNIHFFAEKEFVSDHPQVISDEEGVLIESMDAYSSNVRRIRWYDPKEDKEIVFLTNHHDLAPEQVAEAHKARWQIELFFKWMKQHLKIQSFVGTSQNAVLSQIWIAMIYFVIVSYIKAQTKLKTSLFLLTKVFSQALFERIHIINLLNTSPKQARKFISDRDPPQLSLL